MHDVASAPAMSSENAVTSVSNKNGKVAQLTDTFQNGGARTHKKKKKHQHQNKDYSLGVSGQNIEPMQLAVSGNRQKKII